MCAWLSAAALSGCMGLDWELDPRGLPLRLDHVESIGWPAVAADLDGDGTDAVVFRYLLTQIDPGRMQSLLIRRPDGSIVEQLNFEGHIQRPHFLDLTGDGRLEILTPVVRNDSLFVTAASGDGVKLFAFFVTSGQPRREPEGELPWDPLVRRAFAVDVNGDGRPELVTVVGTAYARLPRGVFVHRIADGAPLGEAIVGADIQDALLYEPGGGAPPRLISYGWAVNNGASAGGYDDSRAYVLAFDLVPTPQVSWALNLGESFTQSYAELDDFSGDGEDELLVVAAASAPGPESRSRLTLLEPGTWTVLRRRDFDEMLRFPLTIRLGPDPRPTIAALRPPSDILLFDADFELVRRRTLPISGSRLTSVPDIDGDGTPELVLLRGEQRDGILFLSPALRPKAWYPGGNSAMVVRTRAGQPARLLVDAWDRADIVEVSANRGHLLYRYGGPAAGGGAIAAAILSAMWLAATRRRSRLLLALRAAELETGARGYLLADRRGRVRWINDTLRRWLGTPGGPSHRIREIQDLRPYAPGFVTRCRELMGGRPPRPGQVEGSFESPDGSIRFRVGVAPLIVGAAGDPHWLLRFEEEEARAPDAEQMATWARTAQRIAHDLKNPLTSILLTLQRMEMEYRERAPEIAGPLDRFSGRIRDRIEHLRRMTGVFMKFVDLEKPRRTVVKLDDALGETAGAIQRTLPPDVTLELATTPDLPAVWIDRDQISSVLENLVANAVNAMPDGGRVTIRANPVPRGDADGANGRPDRVCIEVIDSGVGIPESAMGRLFQPGFTTSTTGTGLGLAMVRKIVRDHGGEVTVTSRVGAGSCFTVLLPVAPVAGEPAGVSAE